MTLRYSHIMAGMCFLIYVVWCCGVDIALGMRYDEQLETYNRTSDSIEVVVDGDRLDALCSVGATVWTEKEWKQAAKSRHRYDSPTRAQINTDAVKIGDITISEELAKEYFLDCWERPDTIWHKFMSQAEMNKLTLEEVKLEEEKCSCKESSFDIFLWSASSYGCIKSRTPSPSDFTSWMRKKKR